MFPPAYQVLALRHWKKWLPKHYAELSAKSELHTVTQVAAALTEAEVRALMDRGLVRQDAENIVLPRYILLAPEPANAN
jgi:hypothetical protein